MHSFLANATKNVSSQHFQHFLRFTPFFVFFFFTTGETQKEAMQWQSYGPKER